MWWQPGCQLHNPAWTDAQKQYLHTKVVGDFLSQISIFQRIFNRQNMVVGCKVKPLSCQGCYQLSTVSIPVHFDHFEALNHHFIDEPHGGSLIQALHGYSRVYGWSEAVRVRPLLYKLLRPLRRKRVHKSTTHIPHVEAWGLGRLTPICFFFAGRYGCPNR